VSITIATRSSTKHDPNEEISAEGKGRPGEEYKDQGPQTTKGSNVDEYRGAIRDVLMNVVQDIDSRTRTRKQNKKTKEIISIRPHHHISKPNRRQNKNDNKNENNKHPTRNRVKQTNLQKKTPSTSHHGRLTQSGKRPTPTSPSPHARAAPEQPTRQHPNREQEFHKAQTAKKKNRKTRAHLHTP
jgi:hypothetical protein